MTTISTDVDNPDGNGFDFTALNQVLIVTSTGSIIGHRTSGVSATFYTDLIQNSGSIYGTVTGVWMSGINDTTINNVNGIISGGSTGIDARGDYSVVRNFGTVSGYSQGVQIASNAGSQLLNYGTISAQQGVSLAYASKVEIINAGMISGSYSVYGAAGHGIISSADRSTASGLTITNTGTVIGGILIGTGDTALHNSGVIHGDIVFGYGANSLDGAGGTVDGGILGTGGDDSFELGRQTVSGPIDGGDGYDTLSYATATAGVTIDLANGTVTGSGIADHVADFERIDGSVYKDMMYGDAGDTVFDGGAGADLMAGGSGNDVYFVDNSGDRVIEAQNAGNDTVYASASYDLAGTFVEMLQLTGDGNINAYGNSQANALYGNVGNNLLDGRGGAGVMAGGLGNDIYYVDDSRDKVIEAQNAGNDTVRASASFNLAATFVETLILTGTGNIDAVGNSQANTLVGNAGNNSFTTLAGPDTIVFGAPAFGRDVVTDFTPGEGTGHDMLQFATTVFASYAAVMAHTQQIGSDTVIALDSLDTITLQHVALAALTPSDFLFI